MIVRRSGLECSRELRSTRASNPRTCSNAEQPNAADAIRIKCYFGNVGSARLIRSVMRRRYGVACSGGQSLAQGRQLLAKASALYLFILGKKRRRLCTDSGDKKSHLLSFD